MKKYGFAVLCMAALSMGALLCGCQSSEERAAEAAARLEQAKQAAMESYDYQPILDDYDKLFSLKTGMSKKEITDIMGGEPKEAKDYSDAITLKYQYDYNGDISLYIDVMTNKQEDKAYYFCYELCERKENNIIHHLVEDEKLFEQFIEKNPQAEKSEPPSEWFYHVKLRKDTWEAQTFAEDKEDGNSAEWSISIKDSALAPPDTIEKYPCMGKNDTCNNYTYDPDDFFCNSCDPDNNNIEGDQSDGAVGDNNGDGVIDEKDWEKEWEGYLNEKLN